jgi:hypothetical protein
MLAESASASPTVTSAIRQASRTTGANFGYLLATARVESNFNPNATGKTSSAKGLYQFIEQTWLATLKEQGPALGYGQYAAAIDRTPSGQYEVSNPKLQNAVMALRSDPVANATMAGAFTKANAETLQGALGRPATEGELYLAHFLGPAGATRLIGMAADSPKARAAEAFPAAARANPSIFYDKRGQMRSASEVYGTLVGRYDVARGPLKAPAPVAAPVLASTQRTAVVPDTARLNETYAAAAKAPAVPVDTGPVFHGLFRTSVGREAVAPAVSALWTSANAPSPASLSPAVAQVPEDAAPAAIGRKQPRGYDQSPSQAPNMRGMFRRGF